jgi:hypothetical protein
MFLSKPFVDDTLESSYVKKLHLTNSRKFTNNEEEVLLRKILQLSADGFPPQRAIVEEMANTMLRTKNLSSP